MNCFFPPLQAGSITNTEHPAPRGWAGNFLFTQYWGSCLTLPALPLSVSLPLRCGLHCPPTRQLPSTRYQPTSMPTWPIMPEQPLTQGKLLGLAAGIFPGLPSKNQRFLCLKPGELRRWCFFVFDVFCLFLFCF